MEHAWVRGVAVVVSAGAIGLVATDASAAKLPKHLVVTSTKEPGSLEARRAWTDWMYEQTRWDGPSDRVIYGADDRIEVWQETDPVLREMSEAACVVVTHSEVTDNGDGTYTVHSTPWTSQSGQPLCPGEPFAGQPQVGNCSGWFVGGDIIVTAGHCIDSGDIGTWGYLFNFEIDTMGGSAPTIVPADDVYWITGIIDREQSGDYDHCITQVDRPVVGRNPVPIMRGTAPAVGTPLTVIGHPTVLPKKLAGGANLISVVGGDGYFVANLDTYGGNSGSMVVNTDTYEVAGILVRGATDFVDGGGCTESNVLPDSSGSEESSLTTHFENFIPFLGAQVTPPGDTLHFGAVGGPFSDDPVNYSITNPTGDPLDYTVSLIDPQGLLLLDGGTSPLAGTIPGGGNAMFTVSLSAATAGLPAGVYAGLVVVDDTTNVIQAQRTHTVEVGQTVVNVTPANDLTGGGPVGGPFTVSEVYTVTSARPTPVSVSVTASDPWINVSTSLVNLSTTGDFADVTVGIDNGVAGALPAGLYNGSVTFENLDNGSMETRSVTLDVGRFVYASIDTPIGIADNSSFNSTITVGDSYCIGDVDVDMDITHSYQGDLRLILTSPNGTSVTLHDRSGGSDDDIVTRYDDGGVDTVPDGPGTLADFNFEGSAGVWTLNVSDNAGGDTGTLNSWSLRLASTGSTCPPVAYDGSGSGASNQILDITLSGASNAGNPLSYVVTSLPTNGLLYDSTSTAILGVPTTLPDDQVRYKPAIDFAGTDSFSFEVDDGVPSNTASVSLSIGGSQAAFASYLLDSDPGWNLGGQWAYGVPAGASGDPASGATGANVFGYNLAGDYPSGMTATEYLRSKPADCTGRSGVTLQFERWLGVEQSDYDHANIEVSTDGIAWTEIWHNPSGSGNSIDDAAWSLQTFDISGIADNQPTVYVRWGMGPTDGSVVFHGWNIDDIEFLAAVASGCAADVTTTGAGSGDPGYGVPDGEVTGTDIQYFVNAWVAGDIAADITTAGAGIGDPGYGFPDGSITGADIQLYVNLYNVGCP